MTADGIARQGPVPTPDVAWNAALSGAAGIEEARVLLHKQARLVDLQIADLEREDRLRHRSLRIHHVGDLLKLTCAHHFEDRLQGRRGIVHPAPRKSGVVAPSKMVKHAWQKRARSRIGEKGAGI
ncbi:MAG: hypothetical protein WDM91_19330 [Rhizomicrobium sp.]